MTQEEKDSLYVLENITPLGYLRIAAFSLFWIGWFAYGLIVLKGSFTNTAQVLGLN